MKMTKGMWFLCVLCVLLGGGAEGLVVDNGVVGDPEIECGPTSITVNINTANEFEGHVFVKGMYEREECRSDMGGRRTAGINLPFNSCQTVRSRSLNPKGVFVSTTIIVSFHPQFVTKIDKAYRVQCFYMEADKTVDTGLAVSHLTTQALTETVDMPVCRYEILSESNGLPVPYAEVGQLVYHKWHCDTETLDTFCMIVRDCYVADDRGSKRVELVDERGCAKDRYLINNLNYRTDLTAGVEVNVFKFADRPILGFQCQITILVKEPEQSCPKPYCRTPVGKGAGQANPQAGELPPAPVHVYPLEEGSPYLSSHKETGDRLDNPTQDLTIFQPVSRPPIHFRTKTPGADPNLRRVRPLDSRRQRRLRLRQKRSVTSGVQEAGTIDVRTELSTLDISEQLSGSGSELNESLRQGRERERKQGQDLCLPLPLFVLFIALCVLLLLSAIGFSLLIATRVRTSPRLHRIMGEKTPSKQRLDSNNTRNGP